MHKSVFKIMQQNVVNYTLLIKTYNTFIPYILCFHIKNPKDIVELILFFFWNCDYVLSGNESQIKCLSLNYIHAFKNNVDLIEYKIMLRHVFSFSLLIVNINE